MKNDFFKNKEDLIRLPIKFYKIDCIKINDRKKVTMIRSFYNEIYNGEIVAINPRRPISKLIKL